MCCISNRTPYRFLIHTWNVGAAKWVTEEVNKLAPSKFYGNNNIVFFDGYFWFPDQNRLGVYDPVARTWDTLYVPLPNLSPYLMWITEYQGNIYLVDSVSGRGQMRVIMFRLNRLRLVWEKKKICDGLSSFISDESNIMTYGLPRDMSDIVYVWDSHINPDHPVKYSLNTRSFCKRHDGYCVESSNTNEMLHYAAWIEPPQNSGIYDFPIIDPKLIHLYFCILRLIFRKKKLYTLLVMIIKSYKNIQETSPQQHQIRIYHEII